MTSNTKFHGQFLIFNKSQFPNLSTEFGKKGEGRGPSGTMEETFQIRIQYQEIHHQKPLCKYDSLEPTESRKCQGIFSGFKEYI